MLLLQLLIGELEAQPVTPKGYVQRLKSVLQNVHAFAWVEMESSQQ